MEKMVKFAPPPWILKGGGGINGKLQYPTASCALSYHRTELGGVPKRINLSLACGHALNCLRTLQVSRYYASGM